jgi:competence ComEA-like helix-hairpin-helix protein
MFHSIQADSAIGPRLQQKLRSRRTMRNVFAFLVIGSMLLVSSAQAGSQPTNAPLDLNRATAEQLEGLPGIGAVKAAAILAVRDSQGGFASFDELEAVRGIGPSLVAKLRPLVVLGPKAPTVKQATKQGTATARK